MSKIKGTLDPEARIAGQEGLKPVARNPEGFIGLPLDKVSTVARSLSMVAKSGTENPSSAGPPLGAPDPEPFPGAHEVVTLSAEGREWRGPLIEAGEEVAIWVAEGIPEQLISASACSVTPWERATPEWARCLRAAKVAGDFGTASFVAADRSFRRMWPADAGGLTDLHRRTRYWLERFDEGKATGLGANEARAEADDWFRLRVLENSTDPLHEQKGRPPMGEQTTVPGSGLEEGAEGAGGGEGGGGAPAPKKRGRPPGSGTNPKAPGAPLARPGNAVGGDPVDRELRALGKVAAGIVEALAPLSPERRTLVLGLVRADLAAADALRRAGNRLHGRGLEFPFEGNSLGEIMRGDKAEAIQRFHRTLREDLAELEDTLRGDR